MKRCNKCGFSNNDSVDTCIKCRSTLRDEENMEQREPISINKKTIRVMNDEQEPWDQPSIVKPKRNFINTNKPADRSAMKAEKDPMFGNLTDFTEDSPEEKTNFSEDTFILSEIEKEENDKVPKSTFTPKEDFTQKSDFFSKIEDLEKTQDLPKTQDTSKSDYALPKSGAPTVRRVVPDHPQPSYLVAISLEDEKELRKIKLLGNEVLLDRGLLDPSNTSISRNGHANIFLKDGSWYIENKTALKTTFVQVSEPVKLKDGDVVLMGDSLFKFKQS